MVTRKRELLIHKGVNTESKKTGKSKNICGKKGGKRRTRKRKKQFLYNPNNPKKSFDVYIDKKSKRHDPYKIYHCTRC